MQHISTKIPKLGGSDSGQSSNAQQKAKLRASRIWDRMQEMFGNTFAKQYGPVPLPTWMQAISHMSDEQLLRGLQAVAMSGEKFPPTLPQFIALCRGEDSGETRTHHGAYVELPHNPPESKEHAKQRIERNAHHARELLNKLKGVSA